MVVVLKKCFCGVLLCCAKWGISGVEWVVVVGGGGGKFGSEIGFITRWLCLVFGVWCLGIKNPRPGKEKKTGRGLRLINEL